MSTPTGTSTMRINREAIVDIVGCLLCALFFLFALIVL